MESLKGYFQVAVVAIALSTATGIHAQTAYERGTEALMSSIEKELSEGHFDQAIQKLVAQASSSKSSLGLILALNLRQSQFSDGGKPMRSYSEDGVAQQLFAMIRDMADKGDADAMGYCGFAFRDGAFVKQDVALGARYLLEARRRGSALVASVDGAAGGAQAQPKSAGVPAAASLPPAAAVKRGY